jgi:hypothetical protein
MPVRGYATAYAPRSAFSAALWIWLARWLDTPRSRAIALNGRPLTGRPVAEKRRIVELTLCAGTSIVSIAREHGVHENTLIRWRALYRAGKLDGNWKGPNS